MERIAITGSSGYLGSRLVEYFRGIGKVVLGIDVVPPRGPTGGHPDQFEICDVVDARLSTIVAGFAPDVLVHAAFVFTPMRSRRKMNRINVAGTRHVLDVTAAQQIPQLCVISSATAYGAWPDNPVPLDESDPLRARPEFPYSSDKGQVESLLEEFSREYPNVETSWVRPAIIAGPHFDNYLRRFIFGMPFLVLSDGVDTPMQFVHERDVVAAIATIIENHGRGPYNVGPEDWSSIREVAELSGRRAVTWPFWFTRLIHGSAWFLRLPFHESPASFLYFARYPWVVSPNKLQQEFGFQFQYSSRETLLEVIENP